MKKFKETTNYLVVLCEYERGWGSSDFAVHEFETFKDAKEKEAVINSENTSPTAPDYYIQARIITNPREGRGRCDKTEASDDQVASC